MSETQLGTFVPSGELSLDSKAEFIALAAERALRRPASAQELDDYGAIFDLGASEGDVTLGFRAVIRALLTSPYFLYRTELGSDATVNEFTLSDYEVASLLSYSILDAPPSGELLAAAERAELTTASTLQSAVSALLDAPEATAQLLQFATQWLKVYTFETTLSADEPPHPQKDAARFENFDAVRQAMFDESVGYLAVHAGPDGNLPALLTTPLLTGDDPLGAFYLSEPSGAAGGERTGVLALGTLLALRAKETSTSPTLRGLFVRDRFLCQEIHLPPVAPPDISETVARVETRTTRELYEQHAAQPSCAACHDLLDSVGFNFEDLDAAGRLRSEENGVPIDTTGELLGTDVDGPTANHTALAERLAQSEWVRECFARQAFRFYFGQVEPDRGIPPVQAARTAIGGGSFRDAIAAVLTTNSTFQRVRE